MSRQNHVLVLGAGVTGLTSSILLAETGYTVTIVAAHVPGDESIEYTSPWAGAHWRTSATPEEPMVCGWDVETYEYWLELMRREEEQPPKRGKGSGVEMQDSFHYWDATPTESLWWAPHVQNFRQLTELVQPVADVNARTPAGEPRVVSAATCRAPSLNVPRYLAYLRERAEALGVQIVKARVPADQGLSKALQAAEALVRRRGQVDVFVNATGLAAGRLCGDEKVHPIRGQTVLVKGEAKATRTRYGDGWSAYCIPRPGSGTTILGGTKEVGRWSGEVEEGTTATILRRNSWQVPELLTGADGGFEVLNVQCGLRPGRKGGPRMEREVVGERDVVHAYGHGSGGYQNSVGSARAVVRLVGECLGRSSRASARL